MPEKLDKVGNIFDNIKKIGGVLVTLVVAILSVAGLWYNVDENTRQLELLEQRSDKRYKRGEEWKVQLMNEGRKLDDKIEHLEKNLEGEIDAIENEIIYIKGKEGY